MFGDVVSIVLSFIWHVLSGDAYGLWKEHKLKVKAQIIANTPTTDKEWDNAAKKGDL